VKIAILGAGAWGTALAVSATRHAAARHQVSLWARDEAQARAMLTQRANTAYLPGVVLPAELAVGAMRVPGGASGPGDLGTAVPDIVNDADLVVIATPMAGLRGLLVQMQSCRVPVAWLCKGFEPASAAPGSGAFGLLAHEIQAQAAPHLIAGALSGPSFALEVARGQPTALVAASTHAAVREALLHAFHSPSLRVYANDDIVGVEVGGAVKNVLAIAAGVLDGLGATGLPDHLKPGLNARAALITRGLAEMTRLGVALGARAETFMGLSGLGDLVLTATGDLSRNRKVGLLLAQGNTLGQAVASLGHVAEGVYCARTVVQRARQLGLEMPIAQTVVALLDGQLDASQTVATLMGRDAREEA
jgi:glycerol-3-phosphate dehydrogenase (NAD(P)+)